MWNCLTRMSKLGVKLSKRKLKLRGKRATSRIVVTNFTKPSFASKLLNTIFNSDDNNKNAKNEATQKTAKNLRG